jgi:selenocysteine-specific elongation factor
MPQTIEHLAIIDLLGIEHGVVALTKGDLADAARRSEVAALVEQLLSGTRLAGVDMVPVSMVTGEGIDALRERLFAASGKFGARAAAGRFRLAVDRSFTLVGAGTIVTGTVLSGAVSLGDRLTVSPSGLAVRIRAIHAQNRPVERGAAGERCALNLAGEGISKDAVARGDVVLNPELHAPTARIDATLRARLRDQADRAVDACGCTMPHRMWRRRSCCLAIRRPAGRRLSSWCWVADCSLRR